MTRQLDVGGMVASRRSMVWAVAVIVGSLALGGVVVGFQTGGKPTPTIAKSRGESVQASARAAPAFPLVVKPGARYLVDAVGAPFLINGDAGWGLITQLTRDEADRYLDDRRARGFNAIAVMLLASYDFATAPANAYGDLPFVVPGDYSTPNEAYFAHADWVLQRAAEKGFLVLLAPSFVGAVEYEGTVGWYHAMVASGPQQLRQYGEYLGRRYRDFTNILWVDGGDDNPPRRDLVTAIAEGIREFDPRALHTSHGAPNTAALDYWQDEPWLQVNALFDVSHAIYGIALEQPDDMPFFLIESAYENEEVFDATERHIRTQAYHALLCGAAGQVFGNNPVWHFGGREHGVARTLRNVARAVVGESGTTGRIIDGREPGLVQTIYNLVKPVTWQQALASPGAQSMTRLRDLLTAFPWWVLEPDADNVLLIDGLRTGFARAVAARAGDRSFAILYLPSSREITVDLGQLAGPRIAAHWYDPAGGKRSAVAGSPFPAVGSRQFTPEPVDNSSGFDDWVLILESLPSGSVEQMLEARAQPRGQEP